MFYTCLGSAEKTDGPHRRDRKTWTLEGTEGEKKQEEEEAAAAAAAAAALTNYAYPPFALPVYAEMCPQGVRQRVLMCRKTVSCPV